MTTEFLVRDDWCMTFVCLPFVPVTPIQATAVKIWVKCEMHQVTLLSCKKGR